MLNQTFEIESEEGLPIRGVLHWPAHASGIALIVHGFKGFKDWGFFPWIAARLASEGFAACRFDLSRNGVGDVPGQFDRLDLFADDTYSIEIADILRVNEYLDRLNGVRNLPRFLLGHSRGGGVAILAADQIHRLSGIVTWNATAEVARWDRATLSQWRRDGYWDVVNTRTGQIMRMSTAILDDIERNRDRLDISGAVTKLRVPLLVVHGGSDETVPVADARALVSRAHDSSLVIIGRGTHTFGATHPMRDATPELKLAGELTAHFLSIQTRAR